MKKILVAAMLLSLSHAGTARAEVLADGTIQVSGNPALNVAAAAYNTLRKAVNLEMEYTKFIEQRADILVALQKKTQAALDATGSLRKLKADALTEENAAKKLRDSEIRNARGDQKKEAAAEAKYKARKEQLEKARAEIDTVATEMKRAHDLGEKLRKNLEAIDTEDRVNGTKQWADLRKQNVTVQAKMTESTKKVDAALTKANAALSEGSTVDKKELVGAFLATVKLGGTKTDLFVNGEQVKNGGQFAVGKDGRIELRVRIVDNRRKQAIQYKGKKKVGATIDILAADEYNLSYTNGTRTSTWSIEKEEYDWKKPEARTGDIATVFRSSGNGVKNDIAEITIPADTYSNTIRAYVAGEITWKGPTVDSDAEGVSIEIQIEPGKK